jgi:hypothetical protein
MVALPGAGKLLLTPRTRSEEPSVEEVVTI